MAARYGISADEVYTLLTRGRFRVKANVDHATADRYAHELEALGARVQIEEVLPNGRASAVARERTGPSGSPVIARPASGAAGASALRPSGEPNALLMPLSGEVRDRAADPDARGPRHRPSQPSISPNPPAAPLRDADPDAEETAVHAVARRRASISPNPPAAPLRDADLDTDEATLRAVVRRRASSPPSPPAAPLHDADLDADETLRGVVRHRASWPSRHGGTAARGDAWADQEAGMSSWSPPEPGSTSSSLPPQPESRPSLSTLPPQPRARPVASSLPPQPKARPSLSTLPQPEARPSLSTLPPQPELRPSWPTLPPQPASRANRPSLPPQPTTRPTRPSLPPHTASRPSPASLPAHMASRPSPAPLPAHIASRPSPSSLPAHAASRPSPSSLLPTFLEPSLAPEHLDDPPIELGALDRSGLLALATLDDDVPGVRVSGSHPANGVASSAALVPGPSRAGRPQDVPLDLFAPPGQDLDEVLVELADDELDRRTPRRMSVATMMPAASPPPSSSGPAMQAAQPPAAQPALALASSSSPPGSVTSPAASASGFPPTSQLLAPTPHREPPSAPRTRVATRTLAVASPRARLAAGVVLAILGGFIPAHIVASLREERAFRPIDSRVTAAQVAVDSRASYEALDGIRAVELEAKRSARNDIALTSMAIWAAAGTAIAYVWFRRVPVSG